MTEDPIESPGPSQKKPVYPTYRSEDLFGQSRVIVIVHGGREYQLRVTSAKKLILTA